MHDRASFIQMTFYYLDGHTECFHVYDPVDASETQQDIRQVVRRLLDKPWWILNLGEETVFINMANILKVEIKPPIPELLGEEVFSEVQRVTALTRGVG